ncbi:MAG: ThuA domain-containing protein [Puniceicoccaceae bacterium]|nr:MAG: ThuA domain-containing protein [Puniceicoccaceae bacterium]
MTLFKYTLSVFTLLVTLSSITHGQAMQAIELNQEWKNLVAERAPKTPAVEPKKPRKVLIFSLATGFVHWCIPHSEAVIEILGNESGAYETVSSVDIEIFLPERLREFDAVVLNNNCPTPERRNLFHDVLIGRIDKYGEQYKDRSLAERRALAEQLYRSLVDYVADGGGLVLLHGAITNFNYSDEFSDMVGGSFGYHPPQQDVTLIPVQPEHPLLKPFGGKPFVHYDEPYVIRGAYDKFNFAPLLEMETSTLEIHSDEQRREISTLPRYVAWIKPYKQGRVFFSSPSHNAQSFERPELLGFLLNGMQYALGDLECDDQPIGPPSTAQSSHCAGCASIGLK